MQTTIERDILMWAKCELPRPFAFELFMILSFLQDSVNILQTPKMTNKNYIVKTGYRSTTLATLVIQIMEEEPELFRMLTI